MNKIMPIYRHKDILRDAIINALFPFTLYKGKKRKVPTHVFLEYEFATNRLAKKLNKTIKLLSARENKKANTEYQLKLLEEIKKMQ